MPHQVHQVGRILAVVDGEGRIEPDRAGVLAQQPRADAVERAGPGERHRRAGRRQRDGDDALDAPGHLGRRAARKRHQQDAVGIGAVDDQMGDPMRQGVGLAGAGPGDHQQRPATGLVANAMLGRAPLVRIQLVEIGGEHALRINRLPRTINRPDSLFVRNAEMNAAGPNGRPLISFRKLLRKRRPEINLLPQSAYSDTGKS